MKLVVATVLFVITALLVGWGFYGVHIVRFVHTNAGLSEAGQWGDTFGAMNALFGGCAFAGVLATLWIQRADLANQQRQLRETQREQHLQRFDSTFFQLLALLRELRLEVRADRPKGERTEVLEGAEALRYLYELSLSQCSVTVTPPLTKENIALMYSASTKMHKQNSLGPFFRILYSILRRISEDPVLTSAEKARYGNLVRSHLSTAEVGLIGLNGLTKESNNFSDYVTEFRLLKYLPDNSLVTVLKRFYPEETFSARD
jgi:hypothetical protein